MVGVFSVTTSRRTSTMARAARIAEVSAASTPIVWLFCHAASLVRYGRLASFHTHLIRAGIFAFSFFALMLFLVGFFPWLLYLAAVICTLGAVEHLVMLALLPEWAPNLHRGIPDALRLRRVAKSAD